MLKAAIFDMDGLLINSEPLWRRSHIEALDSHGVKITEDDVRQHQGRRTREVVQHWRDHHGLKHVPSEELEADIVGRLIKRIEEHGEELEGATDLMRTLRAKGLPAAIASSSSSDVIEAVIDKLGLHDFVEVVCSGYDEEHGKPHPAVFLTTAKKLGIVPGDCVVFEDSVNGVKAALAAGMKCIAVPEAYNADNSEIHEADLVLGSLADVTYDMLAELWD